MTQEKQKVIRVLQPTKKATKPKGKHLGLTALALGILVISGLLFAFLKNNNDVSASNIDETKDIAKNKNGLDQNKTSTTEDADENDDIHHPQPKLNEITNIFKHTKEAQVAVLEKKPESNNPFDHITNSEKENTIQITDQNKNPLVNVSPKKITPNEANSKNSADNKSINAMVQSPIKPTDNQLVGNKKAEKLNSSEEIGPDASIKIQITKTAKNITTQEKE